jgi:hypothetical protein
MVSLRHPNILQFLGMSAWPPCIVSEYCSRGSVADVLKAARAAPNDLPWRRRLDLVGRLILYSVCRTAVAVSSKLAPYLEL